MQGRTISEKIFSMKSGKQVRAGEFVLAEVDKAMMHDLTGPLAVKSFYEIAGRNGRVWDASKIIILFDHQVPADSLQAARNHALLRKFALEQGILNYDVFEGICHAVIPEKGHVKPGDLIVGADSHTCTYGALGAFATGVGSTDVAAVLASGKLWFKVPETIKLEINGRLPKRVYSKDIILHIIGDMGANGANYKACEFTGSAIKNLSIDGRLTIANMVIEMGGKAGIIEPDRKTEQYLRRRIPNFKLEDALKSDEDASYFEVRCYDVSNLAPQISCPHSVDNVKSVEEVEGIKIDQVFIGSCTNGRLEDLKIAAEIIDGEKIAKGVRMIVIPASREIYIYADKAGILRKLYSAGAIVESPCCGPCMGGSFGLLSDGEVCLSTSNRNFRGRQGSTEAQIYLCSPATAAASAITGVITDPRRV
ncbi:MAG: 3-isopropylmalate dehydratase large subunit [Methanocellales archaeon]